MYFPVDVHCEYSWLSLKLCLLRRGSRGRVIILRWQSFLKHPSAGILLVSSTAALAGSKRQYYSSYTTHHSLQSWRACLCPYCDVTLPGSWILPSGDGFLTLTSCYRRQALQASSRVQSAQSCKHRAVHGRQPLSQLRSQHWKRDARWAPARAQIEGLDEPIADYGVLTQKMQVGLTYGSPGEDVMPVLRPLRGLVMKHGSLNNRKLGQG